MHFFNPVPVQKLVELIPSLLTSDDTADARPRVRHRRPRQDAISAPDRAGFVVNALLMPYLLSAIRMLESGFATAEDIDTGMVLGCAHPMGPLRAGRPDRPRHTRGRRRLDLRGVQGAAVRGAAAAAPDDRRRAARPQDRPGLL